MSSDQEDFDVDDLKEETLRKLKELQGHSKEYSGFIGRDGNLYQTRKGSERKAGINAAPEDVDKIGAAFHTHPSASTGEGCSVERDSIIDDTISAADVVNHITFRHPIRLSSVAVTPSHVIQYEIVDASLFDDFAGKLKDNYGEYSDNAIDRAVTDEMERIKSSERRETYDVEQKFSECDERDMWLRIHERWNAYLASIGMKLKERNIT
jgi:hypothetical protein